MFGGVTIVGWEHGAALRRRSVWRVGIAIALVLVALGLAILVWDVVGAFRACFAEAHGKPVVCAVGVPSL